MPPIVEEVCTITAKGQTTVPRAVRQALGVGFGGRIAFRVEEGTVTVRAVPEEAHDPALAAFLELIEADFSARPAEAVRPFPLALADRWEELTEGVDLENLDAPIEGEVTL